MQGLQDKIEIVPINLQNRPAWYKEKVYPGNKVTHYTPFLYINNYSVLRYQGTYRHSILILVENTEYLIVML